MSTADAIVINNPFLTGNNEPVYEEITTTELEVIGEVPADISGSFLRTGPNPFYVPDEEKYHICLLYTSPSPRDATLSRMPSSA